MAVLAAAVVGAGKQEPWVTQKGHGQRNKLSSAVMGKKAVSTRSLRPRNPCRHSATWVRGTGGENGGNSHVNTTLFSSETKIREEDGNMTSYALSRWKTAAHNTQKKQLFIVHLSYAQHFSNYFTYIISFHPWNDPEQWLWRIRIWKCWRIHQNGEWFRTVRPCHVFYTLKWPHL